MKRTVLLLLTICCITIINAQLPGNPDRSFGNNGIVTGRLAPRQQTSSDGIQVLLQPDGSIYTVLESNTQTIITKRHANGSLDVNYGNNGYSRLLDMEPANALIQTDGKIVVVGSVNNSDRDFCIARFNVNGNLDSSFNRNGIQTTDFGTLYDDASSVAIQKDGKIAVAGKAGSDFAVARYNPDGSLDNSFSDDGKQITVLGNGFSDANAVAIQSDGKIVLAGQSDNEESGSDFTLVRYNIDGSLDKSFSGNGIQTTSFGNLISSYGNAIAIQADGKLVVAGTAGNFNDDDFAVARYNTNGTPDNSFNADGKVRTNFFAYDDAKSVAIQTDGKIVVAGTTESNVTFTQYFALARYNTDGSPDKGFDNDGRKTTTFEFFGEGVHSLAIQPNGKIVLVGGVYSNADAEDDFILVRYNANGSADNTFDGDGQVVGMLKDNGSTVFQSEAIQSDGSILVAVTSNNLNGLIIRYKVDGTLDNTFGKNGVLTTRVPFYMMAVQKDGRIVAAGVVYVGDRDESDIEVARFTATGRPDSTFGNHGITTVDFSDFDSPSSLVIGNDGKIVVAANGSYDEDDGSKIYDVALARFNADGSLDKSFSGDGILTKSFGDDYTGEKNAVAIQNDDKIVIAGSNYLVRFNKNGSADNGFGKSGFQTTDYDADNSIAIQADGKVLVSGYQSESASSALSRYNSNGSIDSSFSENGKLNLPFYFPDALNAIAIQNDGKIIASGNTKNSINQDLVSARYNTNGSTDYSFGNNGMETTDILGTNDDLKNVAIADNKLYVLANSADQGSVGVLITYVLTSNEAPFVKISSPVNYATYTAPAALTVSANASDPDGAIKYVSFYNAGTLLSTDSTSPYTITLKNVTAGTYTFVAKATDNNGLSGISASVEVLVSTPANDAPNVSLTTPVNNATYPAGSSITLDATASDADGKISGVKFYSGSTLLKTDSNSPYSYTLNSVAAGHYKFFAKAIDDKGVESSSSTVSVFVGSGITNKSPSVTISAPVNNTAFTAPANIILNAAASDEDGSISAVQFYNGSTLLKTDSTKPYSYTLTNAIAGNYSFVAKAIDNKGLTNNSASVAVSVAVPVNKAPLININSPADNVFYYAPATIILSAAASDPDGSISDVKFSSGAALLKTDSTDPYTDTFKNVSSGNYSYVAKATDNKGLSASSASVNIIVLDNKAPVVSLHTNDSVYIAPATIFMSAEASDSDGTISYVDFYNDTKKLGTDSTSPYNFSWINVPAGSYSLTARASDDHGLTTYSAVSNVLVKPNLSLEAEDAFLRGAIVASGARGFKGTGYADYVHASGDYIEWTANTSTAGAYILKFRYSNGSTNRPLQLEVNGVVVSARIDFSGTGSWSTWSVSSATANLKTGSNKIRLTAIGFSGPDVDNLALTIPVAEKQAQSFAIIKSIVPGWNDFLQATVSPNPVSGNANLTLATSSKLPVRLRLADMLGRTYTSVKFINRGTNTYNFSVRDLPAGSYIIVIKQGNLAAHAKVVVAGK